MANRKHVVVAVAVVLVVGVVWYRHHFSPGEVVKRKLRSTVEAFEEEKILGVMSAVSRTYSDPWGFDYEMLGANIHQVMDTYDELRVDLTVGEVEASDEIVRVGVEFIVRGRYEGTTGYVVGSVAEPCSAVLVWRKEQPGWRLGSTSDLDIPELRDELERRRPR